MLKTIQKMTTALAAAGLVLAPVAAQANTRAGDNASFYTASQSQPGLQSTTEGESIQGTGDIIALFLAGLWVTGIIIIAADVGDDSDDDDNQSPGAN